MTHSVYVYIIILLQIPDFDVCKIEEQRLDSVAYV